MKKERFVNVLKVFFFMTILVIIMKCISAPLTYSGDPWVYQRMEGFYSIREDSVDAVFIGTSNTYAFWAPLIAWKRHGLATASYTQSGQHLEAYKNMIEEARKTQPDALMVLSISDPDVNQKVSYAHWLTDYMRESTARIGIIKAYKKYNKYSLQEVAELILPLLCYHSRWNELTKDDYNRQLDGTMASSYYKPFLASFESQKAIFQVYIGTTPMQADMQKAIKELLDYCDEKQVNALFINPVQCLSEEDALQLNSIFEYIESRGYPVIKTCELTEEMALDLGHDFYNDKHMNIHGAIKYTEYISKYLIDRYNLEDRRGNEAYNDFDRAYEQYEKKFSPYVFEFELDGSKRTNGISSPLNIRGVEGKGSIKVMWNKSDGADGYVIFRRIKTEDDETKGWEEIGKVEGEIEVFEDVSYIAGCTNQYTVVPYVIENDKYCYGNVNYSGYPVEAV